MRRYPIFYYREKIGEVSLTQRGLYITITGVCSDPGPMLRLWLVGERVTMLLGTAVPEGERLVCRRTISQRQMPERLLCAVALSEGMAAWQERDGLWYRITPKEVLIAEPYEDGAPIQQLEHYPQLHLEEIDGTACLVQNMSLWEFAQGVYQMEKKIAP